MNDEYNFDYSTIKDNMLRFGIEMLNYIKDNITELVNMNYMMKNIEIDKLNAFLFVKVIEFYYIEFLEIQSYFDLDFTDTNNSLNHEITKILDIYFNICFNQAVVNSKLNNFVEIYFFLIDISIDLYKIMKIDQNNVFIKFENGIDC